MSAEEKTGAVEKDDDMKTTSSDLVIDARTKVRIPGYL